MNLFGIRSILPYFFVGIFLWFFMLESGIHATIAGVLAAFTIPSRPKTSPENFTTHTRNLLDEYDSYPLADQGTLHERHKAILQNIKDKIDAVSSPAAILEHTLHLPVGLVIIPVFALANAAIPVDLSTFGVDITSRVALGIIFGLVLGKIIGIFGIAYIATKLKLAQLPSGASLSQIFGVSALAGIGFTMSIFVSDLAFIDNEALGMQAKLAIIVASLCAGALGFVWLRFIAKGS